MRVPVAPVVLGFVAVIAPVVVADDDGIVRVLAAIVCAPVLFVDLDGIACCFVGFVGGASVGSVGKPLASCWISPMAEKSTSASLNRPVTPSQKPYSVAKKKQRSINRLCWCGNPSSGLFLVEPKGYIHTMHTPLPSRSSTTICSPVMVAQSWFDKVSCVGTSGLLMAFVLVKLALTRYEHQVLISLCGDVAQCDSPWLRSRNHCECCKDLVIRDSDQIVIKDGVVG